jgi:hypothetical protein
MKPEYEVFDYKKNFDILLKIFCYVFIGLWLVDGLKFLP